MPENKNYPDNNSSRPEEVREDQFSKNANVPAPTVSQDFTPPDSAAPVESAGTDAD
jgi:hypothetical protein